MKKWKQKLLVLLGCSLFIFSSCADYWDDYEDYIDYEENHNSSAVNEQKTSQSSVAANPAQTGNGNSIWTSGAVRDKQVNLKGDGSDTVTILIYMNGSNLETDDQEATTDLSEMVAAGSSDQVNILVQTMGTKKWDKEYGIASNRSQIYSVDGSGLTLLKDDLGQLDCTEASSLRDFIIWGAQNYPADRYILHFWDHGGGPVYGFGYDEWNSDENAALTIDEMQSALKEAGVYFDFVGMDCCLMSCLEVCCAFYDYCDYMILSEDFESGLGWSYTNWLKKLYQNPSMPTVELGKIICDDMVRANEVEEGGDKSSMAIIDQSVLKVLFKAWTDFAYANQDKLLGNNYSRTVKRGAGGRVHPAISGRSRSWNYNFWGYEVEDDEENLSMAEYYVTDIMEVASAVDSPESAALSSALDRTLVYVKTTESDAGLTGIAVSLPYGDSDYYLNMKPIFSNIGLDAEYVSWLSTFVGVTASNDSYDHDSWDDSWDGWDEYEDDYDWEDWEYYYNDGNFWDDLFDWDDWDYDDSWNNWYDDDFWSYDEDDGWDYEGNDWYYGDYFREDDNWFNENDYGGWDDDWYNENDYGGWDDDWY